MFAVGALDVAQPSMTKIGGIGEMRRIATLAQVAGVRLLLHCAYFGPRFLSSLPTSSVLAPESPFQPLYVKLEAGPLRPLPWCRRRQGQGAERPRARLRSGYGGGRALSQRARSRDQINISESIAWTSSSATRA